MPYKHCQHLENYGLARTAKRALLLALFAPSQRVPRAVKWGEIFGDDMAATAMIDRLIHHSEILSLKGDSYRLRGKDLDTRTATKPDQIA